MTRDEIIKIATDIWGFPNWTEIQVNRFVRFANIIQEIERNECAKVADEWVYAYHHPSKVIAETIRAREQA